MPSHSPTDEDRWIAEQVDRLTGCEIDGMRFGYLSIAREGGLTWFVSCLFRGKSFRATGATPTEAWNRAISLAVAAG